MLPKWTFDFFLRSRGGYDTFQIAYTTTEHENQGLIISLNIKGYKATVTYEGAAKPYVPTYKAQASSYKPVKTYRPAPKATEKKDTAKPGKVYYKPAPKAEAKKDTSKPYYKVKPTPKAEAKKDISKPGEVYYKPVKNAPNPKVYYKPVENAKPAKVYYKPIDA